MYLSQIYILTTLWAQIGMFINPSEKEFNEEVSPIRLQLECSEVMDS